MGAKQEIKGVITEMLAPNYARQGENYGLVDGVLPDALGMAIKVVGPSVAVKLVGAALDMPADNQAIARLAAITLVVVGTQAVRDLRSNRNK